MLWRDLWSVVIRLVRNLFRNMHALIVLNWVGPESAILSSSKLCGALFWLENLYHRQKVCSLISNLERTSLIIISLYSRYKLITNLLVPSSLFKWVSNRYYARSPRHLSPLLLAFVSWLTICIYKLTPYEDVLRWKISSFEHKTHTFFLLLFWSLVMLILFSQTYNLDNLAY